MEKIVLFDNEFEKRLIDSNEYYPLKRTFALVRDDFVGFCIKLITRIITGFYYKFNNHYSLMTIDAELYSDDRVILISTNYKKLKKALLIA